MHLKNYDCPKCGGALRKEGDFHICQSCRGEFTDDSIQIAYEKLQANLRATFGDMVQEELIKREQEKFRPLLAQLWDKTQAKYTDSKAIVRICRQIKEIYPDNFIANFYEVANSGTAEETADFINHIDVKENEIFIEDVIKFMIKSLEKGHVASLNYLIERAYKNTDMEKFAQYCTLTETEAQKIDGGMYIADLPRNVFVAYSSKDLTEVLKLVNVLEEQGVTCFFAMRNLRHGRGAKDNYEVELEKAMDNCEVVVFVSSKNSRNINCDAFKVEIPYIKKRDIENTPAGYKNSYAKTPLRFKKPRIEYRLDNVKTPMADGRINEFFAKLEYCKTLDDVQDRLVSYLSGEFGQEEAMEEARAEAEAARLAAEEKAKQDELLRQKIAEERKAAEAARLAAEEMAKQAELARKQAEEERKAAERKVAEAVEREAERVRKEKEAEKNAAEEKARQEELAKQKAEAERKAAEKNAAEEKARQEELAKQKAEAERKATEEKAAAQKARQEELARKETEKERKAVKRKEAERKEELKRAYKEQIRQEKAQRQKEALLADFVIEDSVLTGYKGKGGDVVIPDTVTCIGRYAFSDCKDLNNVIIPSSVKQIIQKAFLGCSNLRSVTIPSSVTNIGEGVFFGCNNLTIYAEAKEKPAGWDASWNSGNRPVIWGYQTKEQKDGEPQVEDCLKLGADYYYGSNGKKQDYAEAVKWFRKAVDQGDAEAQCWLGACYELGKGVTQNYAEAVKYYRKGAAQNNAASQCNLGVCYYHGNGVAKDELEAVKWFKKAADQGNIASQHHLGSCYHTGRGVTKDDAEAIKWYRKAADQGYAKAQYSLGVCYHNGSGVKQDYAEAKKWYKQAADQGHKEAKKWYDQLVVQTDDKKQAQEWLKQGNAYYHGINGANRDYAEAARLYKKAADKGNMYAQFNLGVCYYTGKGETKNYEKAAKLYRQAADQGHADAQCWLGVCYYNGYGVTQDYVEAVRWYTKAANQGNATAQYNLGTCYYIGNGVTANKAEAKKWYKKAADQGHANAKLWYNKLIALG